MLDAANQHFSNADIAIFSAAVADFRPVSRVEHKIKKHPLPFADSIGKSTESLSESYMLELTANPDIIATLAANKNRSLVVGFAAETENVIANAQAKLVAKNADLIVANDVSDPHLGFASANNKVWLIDANSTHETDIISKNQLASLILDTISAKL
jgi:phosphopantothenoylcysteine decarboxylase/phosphopantothenate--cysteine ligase